jgi:C_GCAxxG_C_C family probable redox protein
MFGRGRKGSVMEKGDIDRAAQRARELFESDFWCAESVLMVMAEEMGIESDLIPRIATGFCSGVAQTRGRCGATSGAILGINLASGRREPGASVEANYALVQRFQSRFEERFGSTACYDLIGCDLGTEKGQKKFRDDELIELCYKYAQEATRMALEVLKEGA